MSITFILILFFILILISYKNKLSTSAQSEAVVLSVQEPSYSVYINTTDQVCLQDKIKEAFTDEFGFYPHEILILSYCPKFTTNQHIFQKFWADRYGIENVKNIVNILVEKGCLVEENFNEILNKLKLKDLKFILEKKEIDSSGKKNKLIEKIIENVQYNEINNSLLKINYKLTDLGNDVLKKSEYIPLIHKRSIGLLDIWEANKVVNKYKTLYYKDAFWAYLNDESLKQFSKKNFGLYSICRNDMASILIEENKFKDAIAFLSEVFLCNSSGLFNMEFMDNEHIAYYTKTNNLIHNYNMLEHTVSRIEKAQIDGNINEDTCLEIMKTRIGLILPTYFYHPFSNEEILEIFHSVKNGSQEEFIKICNSKNN